MDILAHLPEIITCIFLLTIFSYYILLIIPKKNVPLEKIFKSATIIIPAHNEEEFISECLNSVISAKFKGTKQIIVIDDGSRDNTLKIVKKFERHGVTLIKTKHSGKSASINRALKVATGELICIVDADSIIGKDSLVEISKEVGKHNFGAACSVVKVKNRKKLLCIWPHIEQIYNSLIRHIFSKINANITTPGPLSAYRKKVLDEIGGFSTEGFSEDVDVTIRIIRKGYKVGFAERAVSETNLPYDMKGFLRQRTRFARGLVNILKRHIQINTKVIDLYTMPLFFFGYIQAIVMGIFTIYQISSGYITYYASKGVYFSFDVLRFFFDWFSIIGFIKWAISVINGTTPLTVITIVGILSTLLSYPLYIYAIFKFDKKFDIYHLIPIIFMAPFWWFLMIIYILCLPEMFRKNQYNIWKKNE